MSGMMTTNIINEYIEKYRSFCKIITNKVFSLKREEYEENI